MCGGVQIKKVMVVDDNAAILEIVSELISAAGYQPITATGGKECLARLPVEKPDLVLLDINMPDMDGWTVLRTIKEKGLAGDTKVMMLTATTEIGTDIFGLQDVVSGYIRKPFNNEELRARLKEVLDEQPLPPKEEPKPEKERKGLFNRLLKKDEEVEHTGMEVARNSAKVYELRRGFQLPGQGDQAPQVLRDIRGPGHPQHPGALRHPSAPHQPAEGMGPGEDPIIWLSNQLGKVYVNPTNIGILSDTIIRFVEKSGDSVVLIDGVEFPDRQQRLREGAQDLSITSPRR